MMMRQKVDNWLKVAQSVLFPPHCLLCGAPGEGPRDLCAACFQALPHNSTACSRCALPLAGGAGGLCGACLKTPPPLDGSIIPFRYDSPVDQLLLGLKFRQRLGHGRLLGGLLADAIEAAEEQMPEVIVPVPLHPRRMRERGYNQALELARPLARRLALPLEPGLALRNVATAAQSSLERGARRRNIKGAFSVQGAVPRQVAIVDDVVTTGSTVYELARMLRREGAERIVVWACARAG